MRQDKQQKDDNKRIEKSQKVIITLDMAQQIPADAPVRLLGEILDKMDFGSLERAEKRGAQRRIPGRILFGVLVFGEMKCVYSSRKIERYIRIVTGICADGTTPKIVVKENEYNRTLNDCNKHIEKLLTDLKLTPKARYY